MGGVCRRWGINQLIKNMSYEIIKGSGKTRILIQADTMGNDLVVRIFNAGAHIGAVAIGEYDLDNKRVSVSVVTRLGHKDDAIAQKAAYLICKAVKKPVCVVAGAHIEKIRKKEIDLIQENVLSAIEDFLILVKKEASISGGRIWLITIYEALLKK
jgi:hypothetical protein